MSASASGNYSRDLKHGTETRSSGVTGTISYEIDLWGKLASARDASRWEAEATESDRPEYRPGPQRNHSQRLLADRLSERAHRHGQWEVVDYAKKTLELVEAKYAAGAVTVTGSGAGPANPGQPPGGPDPAPAATHRSAQRPVDPVQPATEKPGRRTGTPPGRNPAPVAAGLPASLLGRRPDLRAAEQRLKKYLAAADNTKASYYPSITLTGNLGTSSISLTNILQNPYARPGVGLALPFIQWNTMKLNVEISKSEYEEAVVNFRQTLYAALSDVENALSAGTHYGEENGYLRESLEQAITFEQIAEIRYREGAVPLQTWLDAQETRRSAENSLAENRLNRLKNRMTLYQALGGAITAEQS